MKKDYKVKFNKKWELAIELNTILKKLSKKDRDLVYKIFFEDMEGFGDWREQQKAKEIIDLLLKNGQIKAVSIIKTRER